MDWFRVASPIGELGVRVGVVGGGAEGPRLLGVSFTARGASATSPRPAVAEQAALELAEYFAGDRTEFEVPLAVVGGSAFEQSVWAVIAGIPYGETMSYGAIARAIGDPKAAQAVGTACHNNPVPVIIPCHRVIGSNGKLVGFGGGLDRKRFLLQLEARVEIERSFAP